MQYSEVLSVFPPDEGSNVEQETRVATNQVEELIASDRAHHLHPWTEFDGFHNREVLPFVCAEGAYLTDIHGSKYLDAAAGLWCNNIGYGRTEMTEAIASQVKQLTYANTFGDLSNQPAIELAKKITTLAPGNINRVFYSSGGSTANDTAFRLVQYFQRCRGKLDKRHFIARKDAYHGSTYLAMSLSGKEADRPREFEYIADTIHHISSPDPYRRPEGMEDLSEKQFVDALLDEFANKVAELGGAEFVAGFFAEPIMGAGGVIVAPEGYLKRMWEFCKDNDIAYISDEVITAFGRLGKWFASRDYFDIQPDVITSAKGITSGYLPLGATLFSDDIYEAISAEGSSRCFSHGFTYSGHPVCCAAAKKNIEILESEGLLENVSEIGPYLMKRLIELEDLPIVGNVRGAYFMACIELVRDKNTKEPFGGGQSGGDMVAAEARRRGLIVRPMAHKIVLSPPLILDQTEVDYIVDTLIESIKKIAGRRS